MYNLFTKKKNNLVNYFKFMYHSRVSQKKHISKPISLGSSLGPIYRFKAVLWPSRIKQNCFLRIICLEEGLFNYDRPGN